MSLRKEIKAIIHRWKYTCTIPNEDFDEAINKVLDAAIEAINESCDEAYGWNDREHLIKALEALKEAK